MGGDYDAGKSLFRMEAAPNRTTKGGQLFLLTFHIIQTRILVSIFPSHKHVPTIYDTLFLYLAGVGGG